MREHALYADCADDDAGDDREVPVRVGLERHPDALLYLYNTNEHQENHFPLLNLLDVKSHPEEGVKGKSLTRDGGTKHTIEEDPKHSPGPKLIDLKERPREFQSIMHRRLVFCRESLPT
jgi:hypothetical protein